MWQCAYVEGMIFQPWEKYMLSFVLFSNGNAFCTYCISTGNAVKQARTLTDACGDTGRF